MCEGPDAVEHLGDHRMVTFLVLDDEVALSRRRREAKGSIEPTSDELL